MGHFYLQLFSPRPADICPGWTNGFIHTTRYKKSQQLEEKMNTRQFFKEFTIYFCLMFVVNLVVTYLWNLIFKGTGAVDWPRSIIFPILWAVILPLANTYVINREKK
jgi:hypothetical protein